MTGALVAALTAPLRAVQSMVGPGWSGDTAAEPVAALARARDALSDISAATRRSWRQTEWTGAGADGAAAFMARTQSAIDSLADRADRMNAVASTAGAAVTRAHERLRDIIEDFESRAAALEPFLDSPEVVAALRAEAQRSLADALSVVEELQAELDEHASALARPSAPPAASTAPSGIGSAMPSMGSGMGGAAPMSPLSGDTSGSGFGDLASLFKPDPPASLPEAGVFGDGVAIRLPDGSTATAPNATAASAVRHALTQLGVPYDWGGTTPGIGLDCSGLTQWAYSEAGLSLPRLAQEQDVGAPVAAGNLRPGDLAVWDGHVAMIVGNGQMVEAGDPVQLSPIRATNAGQGFQGFWRPTA
ncbi:C40 family peptidase [Mycolicibacterium tusciae]|uniref:Glycoside hydrolase n=1 Tax=Mycolicibacterium tusciae TaxID=75922 RepID=A0A1X0JXT5_9MYCO|nr:C40 family peptidase [Mycolicibacterium tusciae]ORB66987.1 glycoside hydrolase [Mycolicibacterium tusciae]